MKKQSPTMTEYLAKNLGFETKKCSNCLGLGFYLEVSMSAKKKSTYALCSCKGGFCKSRNACKIPYEIYDTHANAMKPCECRVTRLKLQRIHALCKSSGIPHKYMFSFLDNIDITKKHTMSIALDCATDTIINYQSNQWLRKGLYIHGGTGSGKTLLACTILNEIIRFHQLPVLYAKINRDILGKLRSSFNPSSEIYGESQKIQNQLLSIDILVIDDLGAHNESEWVNSVLYDILDARYENDKMTIITSNEPISFWQHLAGGRIYSRLHEMCRSINIEEEDYRIASNSNASFS